MMTLGLHEVSNLANSVVVARGTKLQRPHGHVVHVASPDAEEPQRRLGKVGAAISGR
jgi:hypothetical protein